MSQDAETCPYCHREHTAVSAVSYTDSQGDQKNALLIGGNATSIQEFCYTCHGQGGQGAHTNVQAGVYEAANEDLTTIFGYKTDESETGAVLNSGGYEDMGAKGAIITSSHLNSSAACLEWGEVHNKDDGGTGVIMDCISCHDPHGSSNYRMLRDEVNGIKTGGPTPWVISNEIGYPTGGFRQRLNYCALGYKPDYTEARYAQPVDGDPSKGISGWCASCHTDYNVTSSCGQGGNNVTGGYGNLVRHRHPVNRPLASFTGGRSLLVGTTNGEGSFNDGLNDPWNLVPTENKPAHDIPLEHDAVGGTENRGSAQVSSLGDYIGCLTCHRAHSTASTMDSDATSATSTTDGVQPTVDSALLRADNGGACERCHNK
jgi:hypothetical protein